MFRDDLGAAVARIEALEAELAALRGEHEALVERLSSQRLYHFTSSGVDEFIDKGNRRLYGALGELIEFDPVSCCPGALTLSAHPLEVCRIGDPAT